MMDDYAISRLLNIFNDSINEMVYEESMEKREEMAEPIKERFRKALLGIEE